MRPTRPVAIDGCSGGDRRSRAQKLHLAYAPVRARTRSLLTALRHFADHCPAPSQLSMTKLAISDALDVPPAPRGGGRARGLRFLDLKMTLARNYDGGRLEKAIVARYVDWLFPNLVLSERETAWLATKQMLVVFT